MRVFKFFGIVLPLVLFSCNTSTDKYEAMDAIIEEANALYQHPNGERYNKTDADTLDLASELKNTSSFFLSRHDNEKAAKAFLLYGYAQKEANDKATAMKAFKDAEYYGTLSRDSLTTARAQFNIARLLFSENNYDESLSISKLAVNNYGHHYDELAYLFNLMASSYIMQKDYTNAEHYLKKAMTSAEKGQSKPALRKIINNYSVYYREQKMYDKAIEFLLQNKNEADSTDLLMFYINTGTVYVYCSEYDSAALYMQKALKLSTSVKTKPETVVTAYYLMSYISEKLGNYSQALAYHKKYTTTQYNIKEERNKKNIYRIQKQYDYEVLLNQMHQKIIEKQRIILIISFLLLLASIIVIGLLARQKKLLKEDERIRKELDNTKEELQKSVKAEVVEKELSRQLHLIITANHISETADDFKKEWSTLVYRINNERSNKFEAALAAIERVYPDMYATIQHKYPNLNETETKVMLLSCSDLSNKEIAAILELSIHTVNKCRSEINRKIM